MHVFASESRRLSTGLISILGHLPGASAQTHGRLTTARTYRHPGMARDSLITEHTFSGRYPDLSSGQGRHFAHPLSYGSDLWLASSLFNSRHSIADGISDDTGQGRGIQPRSQRFISLTRDAATLSRCPSACFKKNRSLRLIL